MHPRPRFAALALSALTFTALLPIPRHEVTAASIGTGVRASIEQPAGLARRVGHPPSPPVRPPSTTTTSTTSSTTTTAPAPVPTTTTTTQAPQPVQAEPAPVYAGNPAGSVNGYPCGGDLPPCYVLERESGGNPLAENPRSSASGLWQFIDSTWADFGGYRHASHAPPEVQNEKARLAWAGGAGCSHWSAC